MSETFPLAGTGPAWHLSVAFDPDAHHPFFHSAGWGSVFASRTPLPPGVDVRGSVVPEGLLMRYRCSTCGARTEVLTDFRSLNELYFGHASSPMDFADFGVERAHGIERLLHAKSGREWAERHDGCPAVARSLPRPVERIVGDLRADAARSLRQSGEAADVYAAVLGSGKVLLFDSDGRTPGGRALSAFRVREAIRQSRGAKLAAVVAAGEAATAGGTEWRVAVVAGDCGWIGVAEVDRFDCPAPGPGLLGELAWRPLTEDYEAADGLAVRRKPFPLPRDGFSAPRAQRVRPVP